MAPQSTITNALARRPLNWCSVWASISLPVPLSPVTSTVVSVAATRRARTSRSVMAADWKTMGLCCERRSCSSACRRRRSCSARTRCSSARCSRSRATASWVATPVSTCTSVRSTSSTAGLPTRHTAPKVRPSVTRGTTRISCGRAPAVVVCWRTVLESTAEATRARSGSVMSLACSTRGSVPSSSRCWPKSRRTPASLERKSAARVGCSTLNRRSTNFSARSAEPVAPDSACSTSHSRPMLR